MNPDFRSRELDLAAASWDVRLRSPTCTERDRAAFKAWRDANEAHQESFARLQLALGALRQAADHPQVRALRERAELAERRINVRRIIMNVMAAGVAAIAITIALSVVIHREPASIAQGPAALRPDSSEPSTAEHAYSTGIRERRTLVLPDGSSATLNASTRLETVWLPHERRIRLVSGQALFRVAKDPTRPFIVTVGDRTITALGTEFDVQLDADRVRVTLIEGRVAVRGLGRAASQPAIELTPTQQLVAIDGDAPTVHVVDVARSTGWADGQVFFTDEPLPAAVAEMNRESSREIVIGDPSLAEYRVNGMFRSGNQDGFVGAVTAYYPIDARKDDQGRIVLVPRPAAARPK